MTLVPLVTEEETFSAISRQQMMLKKRGLFLPLVGLSIAPAPVDRYS